jgi:hypothetical protein
VVFHHRRDFRELGPVPAALALTNDDAVPATIAVLELLHQAVRLGPTLPRQRTRLTDVEELFGNHSTWARDLNQVPRSPKLPVVGRLRILSILSGASAVKRKP